MKQQFGSFVLRWFLNSVGLWVAARVFGTGYSDAQINENSWGFLLAGLVFSVINAVLRPFIIVLSLPAILLTLGLFTIIVNGLLVYLALLITPGMHMTFWHSVLTGLVISLLNYAVGGLIELRGARSQKGKTV